MAVVRKTRTGKWELDFRSNGRRTRVTFESRREAEEAKRELLISIGLVDDPMGTKPTTLKESIRLYFENRSKQKASEKNEKAYFTRLFAFARSRGVTFVHEIEPITLEEFKTERLKRIKPSTMRREFNTYSAFFNTMIEWNAIRKNPCDGVKLPPVEKNPRRVWSDEEFQLVLTKVPAWAREVLTAMYWLGAGPAELSRLRWGDVDFDRSALILKRFKGTGEEIRRAMPMPIAFLEFIRAKYHMDIQNGKSAPDVFVFRNSRGNRIDARPLSTLVRRAVEDEGLPAGTVPYGMRHKFATEMLEADVGEDKVRRLLGHRSVKTLIENYSHVRPGALRDAMDVRAGQAERMKTTAKKTTKKATESNGGDGR